MKTMTRLLCLGIATTGWIALLLFTLWACAALWFDGPASTPLRAALAAGLSVTVLVSAGLRLRRDDPLLLGNLDGKRDRVAPSLEIGGGLLACC